MSFNRISTDNCTYSRHLNESMTIHNYVMSTDRYEHTNKCRHALGILDGPQTSHIKGNLVDLESDLRGQTRLSSKYCNNKHVPLTVPGQKIYNDKTEPIDTTYVHLPTCQMINYKAIPLPGSPF